MNSTKNSRPTREAARRVMDEATRQRRARKALETLEQDNFHDDPHAGLVMSKKALNLFQDELSDEPRRAKRKTRTSEYYKQRFRKNFAQLLEEDASTNSSEPNYISAQVPHSTKPARLFCAVCGFPSTYTCIICGIKYCSITCQETHLETRCLKWTV